MYTPHYFHFDGQPDMVAFMKQYSFATMVTTIDAVPVATPLPFVVNEVNDRLVLSAHFALANEQAKHITNQTSLVIFAEPHAYISPVHYDKQESVPTWNYMAVHAYGKASIISGEENILASLESMITYYEEAYMEQWKGLPDKYKTGMVKGIVAFEMVVTDLQGKKKLSQNKTGAERQRIVETLKTSGHTPAKDIAAFMDHM